MRVPISLDLHVPNFNYPGVSDDRIFDTIVEIAATLESSGWSSISVMDHLHQIAMVGPPANHMLEGSTLLAAIAARTERLSMGLLVGSVTYRNPALAAKITTTIDIISKGRVWHGIGAGWFEEEHRAYGFDFPELKVRMAMEEEALQILRAMFAGDAPSFQGEHFRIEAPHNNPRPLRGDIPILIGGSGEKKTLRMVATYGDGCNLFGDPDNCARLIGVLERHCEAVGRDPAEITKTAMATVFIAPTHEQAQAKVATAIAAGMPAERAASALVGDPDTVAEQAQRYVEAGIEGLTISGGGMAHDLEAIELTGRALAPLFPVPTAA
ncbi:LLM class F420-dependent oxidoreductase [Conexibacter sp. DBS9H8]|uniref:LLM class F420-dependent oxidoreductase n=1 Tax=Conexibacter sp. DBS9H8 TaxID=2937801 RepID=UPI00200C3366|nr:LLM class F420-dependent oxidoreductase [Conexibacter sp. DBS9H8]